MAKRRNNLICRTINCDEDLSPRSQFDTCPRCRGYVNRWEKCSPAHVMQRKANLERFSECMAKVR